MQLGKGSFANKAALLSLALASLVALSACRPGFGNPQEKDVIANVYGNRSQDVIGDVYKKSGDVTYSPSFSGRW